jgi:RHS repeat-associated protein
MQIFIPSKKFKLSKIENYLCSLLVILSLQVVSQSVYIKPDVNKTSCGLEVIDFLHQNYYSEAGLQVPVSKKELTFSELLSLSKKLNPLAQAITLSGHEINDLPAPCILHLSANHYIALLGKSDNNMYKIFDPAAPHLKAVGITYLLEYFSKNAIIFTSVHQLALLDEDDLIAITGSYLHEYPPPNEDDDCTDCGDEEEDIDNEDCGDGTGSPHLSFNPVNLNLVAVDIPMWYKAGVGPDIALKLVYNGNDHQEFTGGLPLPTQYFPVGKLWSFAYAAFYHQVSADTILVILSNGARETYKFSGNSSTPFHMDNYNKFERYSVIGGYGYALIMKDTKFIYRFDDPVHKKLTSIEDRNGNTVTLQYNSDHNITSVTDANGRATTFTLNAEGRIIQATDPIGRTAIFQYGYTNNEFLLYITDMGGYTSTIIYDQVEILQQASPGYHYEDRITSVVTPNGSTQINYEASGTIGPGNLAYEVFFTDESGNRSKISFEYLTQNTGIVKSTDKNGNIMAYYLDLPNSRIDYILYPDPEATVFYSYDANDNRISISKGTHETTYVYDTAGNMTQMTNPRNKTTFFNYDINDNLTSITDPMNRTVTYNYDANGNLTGIITPLKSEFFTYFPNGKNQSYTDGNNNTIYRDYDSYGYLSEINYPLGVSTYFTNDLVGRILNQDKNGVSINYEYNYLNLVTKIIYVDDTFEKFEYDFLNLTQVTDRGGRKKYYDYDCGGTCRLAFIHGPDGDITIARDPEGNAIELNINGQNSIYGYDHLNRVVKQTNPDGTYKQFSYDPLDNLIKRIDEKGTITDYYYDHTLLNFINYSDNTPDVSFTHNDRGQVTSMMDGTGETTYIYDTDGMVIGKDGPDSNDAINYTYDGNGNRLTMSVPGMTVSYSYDEMNRMSNVISDYASAFYDYDNYNNRVKMTYGNSSYTDYEYDGLNRMIKLTNQKSSGEIFSGFNYAYDQSSMVNKITDNEGNVSNYQYDYAYRLTSEDVQTNSGKILWNNQFSYDQMGNRFKLIKNGIIDSYSYNENNQLIFLKETVINVSGFVYGDSVADVYVQNIKANTSYLGNNQIKFIAYNIPIPANNSSDSIKFYAKVNGILSNISDSSIFIVNSYKNPDGSINVKLFNDINNVASSYINTISLKRNDIKFFYDDNGNLIKQHTYIDTLKYYYNTNNQLIRIEMPNGDYEEYVYDGLGQRIKILKNGIIFRRFIYDNLFQAVVVIDSTDQKQYFTRGINYGGGIGGLICSFNETSGALYYFYNNRGDIINVINTSDSIIESVTYDVFGKRKQAIGVDKQIFGFSTKDYDPQTELIYFGFRYYSPLLGRWITRDPIGFRGGFNLYRYVNNNPVNYVDPYGDILQFIVIGGAIIIVGYGVYTSWDEFWDATVEAGQNQQQAVDDLVEGEVTSEEIQAKKEAGQDVAEAAAKGGEAGLNTPGAGLGGPPPTSMGDAILEWCKGAWTWVFD